MQPKELDDLFRDNLRALRTKRGMSQAALADAMSYTGSKVHVPYISDIENGVKMPGLAMIARIAEALGVSPSELLSENLSRSA